ncbi:MAG: ParA family protein [bacterium]|nr:ParA family protein [bacterium]
MLTYAFWNNKGGTGKTSLAFQAICRYANKNPKDRVLAIDACPQANLSELFLGGLINGGSKNLLARHGMIPRCSIGGYFQLRLPAPFSEAKFSPHDFFTVPATVNPSVPVNIWLLCGDPLLELQSNAINTLANTQIPGTDTWIKVISWLSDFLAKVEGRFDAVFIDANPSFSIYTQIALSSATRLVLPVMADDSSRRAIQNAFSLVYGLKLPSDIYSKYAFATKLENAGRTLPRVHLIVRNRITQYMGEASAYAAVLESIDQDIRELIKSNPTIFTFKSTTKSTTGGVVSIRDFQTTGVVAFARGCPFYSMPTGRLDIGGLRVRVDPGYKQHCIEAIDLMVNKL